jgi:HSP20 family molecular chaperone IbpA
MPFLEENELNVRINASAASGDALLPRRRRMSSFDSTFTLPVAE